MCVSRASHETLLKLMNAYRNSDPLNGLLQARFRRQVEALRDRAQRPLRMLKRM